MICSDCEHYNYVTLRCYKLGLLEPLLQSCMHHLKIPEVIRKDQAIWWGCDKDDPAIQWYLCSRCNEWFSTDIHYCSASKAFIKSLDRPPTEFIDEKEMQI